MKDQIGSNDTNEQPEDRKVNLGRHRAQCSVCKHLNCKDIEEAWLDWTSPAKIKFDFGVSRDALYRHCRALGLDSKRRRNLMPVYEGIVEYWRTVGYTGSNILSALKEIAKSVSAEKVVDTAQSADEKPAAQEETAKESDSGALAGPLAELLDNVGKAAEAPQPADPIPAPRETTAKERHNGVLAGYISEMLDEMSGAELGKSQDGNVEGQSPQTPTVQ